MSRIKDQDISRHNVTRRKFVAGAAASTALIASPAVVRAQGGALKVGVILPLSGVQAGIGQSCKRGVDIAPALLKQLGYTQNIEFTVVDFETNVDVARARAERLIADGCHMLSGPFDSGAAAAIAQVCEQKGVPFMINIAAAPQITEQGYKFVFRNFPTGPMILRDAFLNQKAVFQASGVTPKTAVMMHVNDDTKKYELTLKGAGGKTYLGFDDPNQAVAFERYLKDRFKPFRDKERPADYGRDLSPNKEKTPFSDAISVTPSPSGDLIATVTGNRKDGEADIVLLSSKDGSVVRNLTPAEPHKFVFVCRREHVQRFRHRHLAPLVPPLEHPGQHVAEIHADLFYARARHELE